MCFQYIYIYEYCGCIERWLDKCMVKKSRGYCPNVVDQVRRYAGSCESCDESRRYAVEKTVSNWGRNVGYLRQMELQQAIRERGEERWLGVREGRRREREWLEL